MKVDNVLAARNDSSGKCSLFAWKKKKQSGWSARPQPVIMNELYRSALENVDSSCLLREIKTSANPLGRLTPVEITLGTPNNKSLVFTQWEECQLFLKSES